MNDPPPADDPPPAGGPSAVDAPDVAGGLAVRPARPDEFERAGQVAVAAYEADGWLQHHGNGYRAALADAAARAAEAELLVAVDGGGRILGTVTVCLPGTPWAEVCQPGEVEFRVLAVDPPARGRGVGAALVDAVIQRARELGAARVVLSSTVGMLSAQRIYQRMGFTRLPHRDWRPRPEVPLIAFGLDLHPLTS